MRLLGIALIVLLLPSRLAAYDRIVSLKPNVTEILFSLGLGPKIVGVTTYCHHPPEAEALPKVGGYSNPNLEKILGLRPDLVILIPESSSPRMEEAIRRAGIETLVVRTDTLPSVFQAITSIAEKTGTAAAGRKLTDSIHEEMRALEARIPRGARKKVLVVIQRKPLIAAGGRNFFDDLVRQAGADNIAGDSSLPYPRFSMDSVIAGKPDVILDLDPSPTEDSWSVYATLPAVQAGRIFQMTPDHFLPGPRVAKSLEILTEKIHGIPP